MADIQRTARRSFQSQTRTKAIGIDTSSGDERASILNSLSKFAQVGSVEANREQRAEIETKKVLGASRAAQDLLKTEQMRQGVTDDDVLATKLSYNAIIGKDATINAGNSFAEWYKSNPDADDDLIADKKSELYQPLFEKYGSDPQSLKQISLQVQESQFQLSTIQDTIKAKHTKSKNQEALGISIGNLMSTPNADMDAILDVELPARAKALGLTEFDLKSQVMKDAALRAGEGDSRMLDKLKTLDWAKDSAVVAKATSEYERFVAREQAPAIGNEMANIELENIGLGVPWATTLNKIGRLNKQYPNTYSAARIASLKKARSAAVTKGTIVTKGTQDSFRIYTDSSASPLASDPEYTSKDRRDIISDLESRWADKKTEMKASGYSEKDADDVVLKDQLKWSRLNKLPIPSLQQAFNAVLNVSPDEIGESGKMPDYVANGVGMIKTLDASAIDIYMSSNDDKAFALNVQKFSQNMTDEQAYSRASRIRGNPYKVTPDKRTEQIESSSSIIKDRLTNTLWETFSDKDVELSVPEWQQTNLISRWTDDASSILYAGGNDVESNSNHAVVTNLSKMSQMFNGTLVNQTLPSLYNNISKGRPLDISKTNDYVEAFILSMKPALDEEYGSPVDVNELTLDFSRDGSSFTIIDSNGDRVGAILNTEDIYEVGKSADLKHLQSLNTSEDAQLMRDFKKSIDDDIENGVLPDSLYY